MLRKTYIFLLAAFLACACGKSLEHSVSELYYSVPSRSMTVARFAECSKGLPMLLDSSSVFLRLDYGKLGRNEAILSTVYNSGVVPLLCVRCGKAAADTSEAAAKLIASAGQNKVNTCYIGNFLDRHAILMLSPSQTMIDEARSHIERGASVMEAPGFGQAVMLDKGSAASLILRNQSARRWLGAKLPAGFPDRKRVAPFLGRLAEWTVLNASGYDRKDVSVSFSNASLAEESGAGRYYSNFLASLQDGKTSLRDCLPANSDFVVDVLLPSAKAYADAYGTYLDANADLVMYKSSQAALKSSFGKAPSAWMAETDPRELVLLNWEGRELLLVLGSAPGDVGEDGVGRNPYPGYIPAIFGEAFRIKDDGFMTISGKWTLYGSREDLLAWVEAEKPRSLWEPVSYSFYVYSRGASLCVNDKNIVLNAD